jgi:hypothetical protein
MKPKFPTGWRRLARREFLAVGLTTLSGCAGSLIRGQNPEVDELTGSVEVEEERRPDTIGDITSPWGTRGMKVEAIALVTGLAGTGSDPSPGPQRQLLLDEMQGRNIESPNQLLASPTTSLVLVRAILPPCVKKEDRVDVQVQIPSRSETTSLRGGWLLQCRMREMEALGGQIRQGQINALSEGHLLVEAAFQNKSSKLLETRAIIPGGAISHLNRTMGLSVREENHSIQTATLVAAAVNNRFHMTDAVGGKSVVATAKRDSFIELQLHPRYEQNLGRYIRIIQNIVMRETPRERLARLEVLRRKLHEPASTERAAWQLEAIGKEAIPVLKTGLESADKEVRFNAAEALAYLNVPEAARPLGEAAKDSSAFRWAALTALGGMGPDAFDVLSDLLHVPSVETRYGAFRALSQRRQVSPLVRGVVLGDEEFSFHVVQSLAEPVVHFSRSRRPELVLFGADQRLKPPSYLFVNKRILIKGTDDGKLKVVRFEPGQENREEICSTELAQLIPIAVRMGASYLDLLAAFRTAKQEGYLDSRVMVEALPRPGRMHQRPEDESAEASEGEDNSSKNEGTTETSRDSVDSLTNPDIFARDRKSVQDIDFNKDESNAWDRFLSRWFGITTE